MRIRVRCSESPESSCEPAQLDAMVDLAYIIGVSAFQGFALVRLFNAGDQAGAAEQS
nr:hypothetical protein [Alcaligenes faecalis]